MKAIISLLGIVFSLCTTAWGSEAISPWYGFNAQQQVVLKIELFISSTCAHCHKADAFFNELATKASDLNIQRQVINEDKNALLRFNALLSEQNLSDFAVPSVYFCNSRWLGFASNETTGKDLLHAMNYCKEQIKKDGKLTTATIATLRQWANANKFDSGMIEEPSVIRYITTIALTDAFSPCAFFCFAAFLAFLFIEKDKTKQWIGSGLFIFAVGLVHYFQQVHTSNFYELLPWLRVPAILIGIFAVYFVVQHHKRKSNDNVFFLLAFLLGLIITTYQQTCVMNWSYIFEQWLHNQSISNVQAGFYQLLYQIIYIAPLCITYLIYRGLQRLKRFNEWQHRLSTIGLLFILVIAACLIAYPVLLSYLTVSLFTLLILVIAGYFLKLT